MDGFFCASTISATPSYKEGAKGKDCLSYAKVALLNGPPEPLTYLVPQDHRGRLKPGWAVTAQLGKRHTYGLIWELLDEPDIDTPIKPLQPLGGGPLIPKERMPFLSFLASYYLSSPGQVVALLPFRSLKAIRNTAIKGKGEPGIPKSDFLDWELKPSLTQDQEKIVSRLSPGILSGVFQTHLIFGATGSGKTLIYLSLAALALKKGLNVLYLLPEIALTEAFTDKLRSLVTKDPRLFVWHSKLSLKTRREALASLIQDSNPRLILGARSSLFLPFGKLGLIIVDEEHDPSYKESKAPYYHARDMAIMLAKMEGCPAVLGSATPSLESLHNTLNGKFVLEPLPWRFGNKPLPHIQLVLLHKEQGKLIRKNPPIAPIISSAISEAIHSGQSVLVFVNKRGFARLVLCEGCGKMIRCPNCSQYLVYHKRQSALLCHICAFHRDFPTTCTKCGSNKFKMIGFGTEKLEQTLTELFPEAQVIRFDRDVLTSPRQIQARLLSLQDQGGVILVGTQLISKGYHMPKMTLAVILLAENMFCFPDFRALERGVQLIAQIAGRTGRGDTPGRVLIQTFMEDDGLKGSLGEEHYPSFVEKELKDRKEFKLPPYWRLALIRVEGLKWAAVERAAVSLRALIKEAARAFLDRLIVLPAAPAPIEQKKAKFEYHILIKAKDGLSLRQVLLGLNHKFGLNGGVRTSVDIDPVDML